MKKVFTYGVLPVIAIMFLGTGVAAAAQNTPSDALDQLSRDSRHGGRGMGMGIFMNDMRTSEDFVSRHTQMFAHQSEVTGIPVQEIIAAWAEGKTFQALLKEKGIDEARMKEKMRSMLEETMKQRVQALVEAGVITPAQAEKRLEVMKKHSSEIHEIKKRMIEKK